MPPTAEKPLVSALCVSRPCRWGHLQRAIIDFNSQKYPERELLVVADQTGDYPSMIQSFVDSLTLTAAVRVLPRVVKCQVDGLQQGAIAGFGSVLALWDDDNMNHPDRLAVQVERQVANKNTVTTLCEGMYYFWEDSELFVVNCARPDAQYVWERMLSTSLMAYRDQFPVIDYTTRSRTSDSLLRTAVQAGRKITVIAGHPFLHAVGVARNEKCESSREYEFHRSTATDKCGRTSAWLKDNQKRVTEALDKYHWDKAVSVEGKDGGAYEYAPKLKWPDTLYPVVV
jgi:hypothetical protein